MTDKNKANRKKQGEPSREFQNFQRLLEGTLSVPKEELDKKRREYKRDRDKRHTD